MCYRLLYLHYGGTDWGFLLPLFCVGGDEDGSAKTLVGISHVDGKPEDMQFLIAVSFVITVQGTSILILLSANNIASMFQLNERNNVLITHCKMRSIVA